MDTRVKSLRPKPATKVRLPSGLSVPGTSRASLVNSAHVANWTRAASNLWKSESVEWRPVISFRTLAIPLLALGGAAVLGTAGLLLWSANSSAITPASILGPALSPRYSVRRDVSVAVTPRSRTFAPAASVLVSGGRVTFTNRLSTPLLIRSAALSPTAFALRLGSHAHVSLRLRRPGLYHYYDALSSHVGSVRAGNQIVESPRGQLAVRQGWIAVIPHVPGLESRLTVPAGQDLFTPKVVVTVVGGTVIVRNHDTDAHNFVVDPASPAGAAFTLDGTEGEPPHGWQRALVLQQAGLYHVYCTLHTRVVGIQDGWHVVVPRPIASGYRSHNAMDAWIVALPATATG